MAGNNSQKFLQAFTPRLDNFIRESVGENLAG